MPVFDQGYQHWSGHLAGHGWRWLVITREGVRAQLKNKVVRILLLLAWLPALLLVAALAVWGLVENKSQTVTSWLAQIPFLADIVADPVTFRRPAWTVAYSYFFAFETFFIMILVLAVGPGLISRDLRFNALPLYFSRPLSRLDYFVGKLGIIVALVAAVSVVPALLAYVMGVAFSLDVKVIRDTYPLALASIVHGLIIAISTGALMLAMSSLSRRSLLVGIAWFGFWFVSGMIANVLVGIHEISFQMQLHREVQEKFRENQPPDADEKLTPREKRRRDERRSAEWQQAFDQAERKMEAARAEAAPRNWRPLFSYTQNLFRVGEWLLDTDTAWVEIGTAVEKATQRAQSSSFMALFTKPPPINERRYADLFVPQYPVWWSLAIVGGLFGLSVLTLMFRVKSLDRLK